MINFKRLFDLVLSSIIFYPASYFIPIIVILKFTVIGEVFYFQERIGINNSRFHIWKFATMFKTQ